MPNLFFCTVCDKPINPSRDKKYSVIHEKCMKKYLREFSKFNEDHFTDIATTDLPKK